MNEKLPILSTRGLTVNYGSFCALDNLSVDIYAGEIVGVIGPNGAGKTSFIKALCGRIDVSDGTLLINSKAVRSSQNRQRLIGLVPQDIGLYPHMSARENLQSFAKIMGMRGRKNRGASVAAALSSVEMDHKSEALISELSGGMKRRINVAAAIMHTPSVLILDEPTAGVDTPARDTVHRLARTLAEGGMAVLLVTHELEQAEALCDKLLVLAGGKTLAFDSPAALLSQVYGDAREVMVRFSKPPQGAALNAMAPFNFLQAELPTIWTAITDESEENIVSTFMQSLGETDIQLREISVRRPGLNHLMHAIEKTGKLPSPLQDAA